jgi:inositol-phosphate transport system permease protein
MTGLTKLATHYVAGPPTGKHTTWLRATLRMLRSVALLAVSLIALALLFGQVFNPLLEALDVDEEFTRILAAALLAGLPFGLYLTIGITYRTLRKTQMLQAVLLTLIGVTVALLAVLLVQALGDDTDTSTRPSLQFTGVQTTDGVRVEALEPDGAAASAGLQVGDIITAIRRTPVTLEDINKRVAESEVDTPFRLRIVRDGEETQLTVRTARVAAEAEGFAWDELAISWGIAAVIGLLGLFGPASWTPYLLLSLSLSPLLLGYLWLIVATFSYRTEGLMPIDAEGNFGGFILDNWRFLSGEGLAGQANNIWNFTLNSLVLAMLMTAISLVLCSMAGYVLSRMEFKGRRVFLSLTLILHSFPAITLLIPVYLVLLSLGNIPLIGPYIGFNSLGGIALVMVSFGLPFGVWLMKGFFDNISWDMERSALIDGATRWRTFWEIILPQIRPGLLALGVFSFMGGWNAYLIPAIFSVGTRITNLPVYIRQLTGEVSPVNWNQVAAVGLFQMIPILVLFVFAQEYLLNIYSGGSKGSS